MMPTFLALQPAAMKAAGIVNETPPATKPSLLDRVPAWAWPAAATALGLAAWKLLKGRRTRRNPRGKGKRK